MQHHRLIKIVFCDQNHSLTGNHGLQSKSLTGNHGLQSKSEGHKAENQDPRVTSVTHIHVLGFKDSLPDFKGQGQIKSPNMS